MSEEEDAIRKWAMVKRDMKQANREVLKRHGLTWPAYFDLEKAAREQATSEFTTTEIGIVQRVEVPQYLHKDSKQIRTTTRLELIEDRA